MSTYELAHSAADGTTAYGGSKGDGAAEVLKAVGFRWGRSMGGWYVQGSRDRAPRVDLEALAGRLRAAGHDVTVDVDLAWRAPEEREADRADRSVARADRLEDRAGRREAASDAAYTAARKVADMIPFGQPVLVDHHSAGRHRRDLARINGGMDKAFTLAAEATDAERAADAARSNQAHHVHVGTTLRRIATLEADGRRIDRMLVGNAYYPAATGASRDRLLDRQAQINADVTYWRGQVAAAEAAGVKVWAQADFPKGTVWEVKIGGRWERVVKANPKTLSIDMSANFWKGYTLKYEYSKVTERREAGR